MVDLVAQDMNTANVHICGKIIEYDCQYSCVEYS